MSEKRADTVKVSVLVPCCNVSAFVRECLESIVGQTLKEIEIICINDGSTDNTLDIIQEFAARDSRIRVLDKKNSGYGDSMNKGLEMARGEYIGIVESDDFVEPGMFEKLYSAAKANDLDICRSQYWSYKDGVDTPCEIRKVLFCVHASSRDRGYFCSARNLDFNLPSFHADRKRYCVFAYARSKFSGYGICIQDICLLPAFHASAGLIPALQTACQ